MVFTAVPRLRNAFSRMGLPLVKLAKDWGSYYESNPAVYSGDLRLGFQTFSRLMTTRPELRDIMRQAFKAGTTFTNNSVSGDT